MSSEPIQITRYPNRRFYARNSSKYVTLDEIEAMIRQGETVEIRDRQTGEDITRSILTQILIERHPEKMLLFPSAMLHFILRANEATTDFLRDYFRESLSYLEQLQQPLPSPVMQQPMQWMKSWLDGFLPPATTARPAASTPAHESPPSEPPPEQTDVSDRLVDRVAELEERLKQLEAAQFPIPLTPDPSPCSAGARGEFVEK